ncbi:MAG: hypothetical protein ACXQTS_00375 [Candidatus Methanospirareceae archaeon]
MGMVEAIPHDILKVKDWRHHESIKLLPDWLREKHVELRRAIKNHHKKWESDKVASCISRLRLRYSYWGYEGGEEIAPFLIKVYGEIERWDKRRRDKLWEEIIDIYSEYEPREADKRVNDLVSNFPQDSRFPLVSLKTHHWVTWALHEQGEMKRYSEIYILKISISTAEFHRLRGMREFFNNRRKYLELIAKTFEKYYPLRVGDDIILVLSSTELKGRIIEDLKRIGGALDVSVFEYRLDKRVFEGKPLYYVKDYKSEYYSIGASEEYKFSLEKAEWEEFLDYPYIAWIRLKPFYNLEGAAEEFLRYAEKKLEEMPRKPSKEKEDVEVPVCPELLISVAEGYMEFVSEFVREINRNVNPSKLKIIESFEESLFLNGLRGIHDAFPLYRRLREKTNKLHIKGLSGEDFKEGF